MTDEIETRAHAEALSRFPHPVDVLTGEPVDDWGYEEYARQAFIGGAIWQAEQEPPTREDVVLAIRRATDDGASRAEDYADAVLKLLEERKR